ncbi:PREDICTED: putative formamidase C869.04 [Populus euphratica]|uniref:Formamidase C869.04 n=1 Tax=Populus euphratica TaxID=75702 RepID=A0AAJ6XCS0_POPEU|nr:PREDICTED: putative formamidase C869.04 [Populus euphratica]
MVDWTGGMIEDDDSAVDVKTIDLSTTCKKIYDEVGEQSSAWFIISISQSEFWTRMGTQQSQMYLLLSCCPCEGRISGKVDSPNAGATFAVPTAICDQVVN